MCRIEENSPYEAIAAEYKDILCLRNLYQQEMNCQIVHDSHHVRGFNRSYLLVHKGETAGYGSIGDYDSQRSAVVMEFYVTLPHRAQSLSLFRTLLSVSEANRTSLPSPPGVTVRLIPAIEPPASRRTLEKAGFLPCGAHPAWKRTVKMIKRGRDERTARTWAEVDLGVVSENLRLLRENSGENCEIMAVVKADAYGHGAVSVARASKSSHLGVACLSEAVELRRARIQAEIYTLSPFLPDEAETLVRNDIVPMVSSPEQWNALAAASQSSPLPARCFLVVDTGMGREGCLPNEARALWEAAASRTTNVRITGIATHFSCADEPDGVFENEVQAKRFADFLSSLDTESLANADDGRGNRGVWLSVENSPAFLRRLERHSRLYSGIRGMLARPGLLLYGIEPFRGTEELGPSLLSVLSWRVRVTLVRELPAGTTVGYGKTYTLARPSHIATLAVGYADGLSRELSNRGHILLRGDRFPIVGRVSMDQCQVDVTDAPGKCVEVGEIATIIGTDNGNMQTALDLAELTDTTPHEPTCRLSRRVPRIYHNDV